MNENSWLYWSIRTPIPIKSRVGSFHEWKFMALLKRLTWLNPLPCRIPCFHEWKFMALLKLVRRCPRFLPYPGFPWMKIHGSIEARGLFSTTDSSVYVSMNENSWLYWSISALVQEPYRTWFPWMKIHGSIEAAFSAFPAPWRIRVSMNENSWLYWSHLQWERGIPDRWGFHEWKFMALLKHRDTV